MNEHRTHSQAAIYDGGRIVVEPRRGRWCVYVVGERGTRALIASYVARYRALEHGRRLAGLVDGFEDL
jgi:hypothetical protein